MNMNYQKTLSINNRPCRKKTVKIGSAATFQSQILGSMPKLQTSRQLTLDKGDQWYVIINMAPPVSGPQASKIGPHYK